MSTPTRGSVIREDWSSREETPWDYGEKGAGERLGNIETVAGTEDNSDEGKIIVAEYGDEESALLTVPPASHVSFCTLAISVRTPLNFHGESFGLIQVLDF